MKTTGIPFNQIDWNIIIRWTAGMEIVFLALATKCFVERERSFYWLDYMLLLTSCIKKGAPIHLIKVVKSITKEVTTKMKVEEIKGKIQDRTTIRRLV